jgi:hypothetical protein
MPRVFLLSPARLDGRRAKMVLAPEAKGALATRLRSRDGVPIGEVFRFMSGLYFRGKLAYAQRFAAPPPVPPPDPTVWAPPDLAGRSWVGSGALVMTANRGLVPAETHVCLEHLEAFAETDIHETAQSFIGPLKRDALALRQLLADAGEVVLLGSIAKGKYTAPLLEVFGDRLLFPADFVGRGDMSRGALLLRCVTAGQELAYAKIAGATLHGRRPEKL